MTKQQFEEYRASLAEVVEKYVAHNSQVYVYKIERGTKVYSGRPTTWTGKIALAYPSDYGYAVDFSKCNKTLYNYNVTACTSNNWMFNIVTDNGNSAGWLLTPISNDGVSAWHVNTQGFLSC